MYTLFDLPYSYQDLEPFIDIHTMGLHYLKHTLGYLNKLNELLISENYDFRYSIDELIYHVAEFSFKDDILFNLGGVLNHNLYFYSMSNYHTMPSLSALNMINKKYGSYDNFWSKIKDVSLKLRGSGYTFVVLKNNELDIVSLSNQESPLLYGMIPLFCIDLWEHAYYLNYSNDKAKYIDNFKEIADFGMFNTIYSSIIG